MLRLFGWVNVLTVKRGVLLFWAVWLSVVTLTNIFDALKAQGVVPATFKFVSGNWPWINSTMDPLGVPVALQATMFLGVIVWELLAAALFWQAVATYRNRPLTRETVTLVACGVNLALWSAFQVLDEVFLAYQPEGVHRVIWTNQLVTLLLLHLLPTEGRAEEVAHRHA